MVYDHDLRYTSVFWTDLLTIVGSKAIDSLSYHPQTDEYTEPTYRALEYSLRDHVLEAYIWLVWVSVVSFIQFSINFSKHDSNNISPSELVLGFLPLAPIDRLPMLGTMAAR